VVIDDNDKTGSWFADVEMKPLGRGAFCACF
jgi:hypothetical protein